MTRKRKTKDIFFVVTFDAKNPVFESDNELITNQYAHNMKSKYSNVNVQKRKEKIKNC